MLECNVCATIGTIYRIAHRKRLLRPLKTTTMPLGPDVQRNVAELYCSAKQPGSRMHALAQRYGKHSGKFRSIVLAAAYAAARKHA